MSDAEDALVGLAADLVEQISAAKALELAGGLPALRDKPLTRRQAILAANPAPIKPDRPGRKHCAHCGSTRSNLVPGPDADYLGDKASLLCEDEATCFARHDRRYPDRPDLVPSALLDVAGAADEAEEAAERRAAEARIRPPAEHAESAGPVQQVPPALPTFDPWAHTMRRPHNRTHVLGPVAGQLYGHAYNQAALDGSEGHQDSEPGAAGAAGSEGPDDLYEAARGQGAEHADMPLGQAEAQAQLEAGPPVPAPRTYRRDRYGRRRYRRR